jgi:uncharacterized membrane protein
VPALTWKYIHLVLNPFPIVLSVVGTVVGLAGWATGRASWERYGVTTLLLAGLVVLPTYYSGIAAGDVVSQRTFVTPGLIETHRSWATWTLFVILADGAFAAFSVRQLEDARLRRFVLLVGIVTATMAGVTGYMGGRIAHGPEERARPAAATNGGAAPGAADADTLGGQIDRATGPATPREPSRAAQGEDSAGVRSP